ncbi:MAG: PTS system fructose subfamily IIA component [Mariprofundaceae bacterium]
MIGIIIIGHGHIASETLLAVEHVLGKQSLVATLDVLNSDQTSVSHHELNTLIKQNDTGHGVLIFADLFGGTPCNIALSCADSHVSEIVSGFNLPAVIKAMSLRQKTNDLKELVRISITSGQQYMCATSDCMSHQDKELVHG